MWMNWWYGRCSSYSVHTRDSLVHRQRRCLTSIDLREPPLDLRRPRSLGIGINIPVQARHELVGKLRSIII
jgi:hypothetical protein